MANHGLQLFRAKKIKLGRRRIKGFHYGLERFPNFKAMVEDRTKLPNLNLKILFTDKEKIIRLT